MLRPELNLTHPPGQIVNTEELDKLAVKQNLSFDEWVDRDEHLFYNFSCYDEYTGSIISLMEMAWNAAKENK